MPAPDAQSTAEPAQPGPPPPPIPTDHVGGEVPQTMEAAAVAAEAASLEPVLPPGGVQPPPEPPQARQVSLLPAPVSPSPAAPVTSPQGLSPGRVLAGMNMHLPVAQSLAKTLLDQTAADSNQKFYLVVVPDADVPYVAEFEAMEAMQAKLVELLETEAAVFPFVGSWLQFTPPPHRYLLTPLGALPLYKLPSIADLKPDASGWVGKEVQKLTAATAKPVAASELAPDTVVADPTPMFAAIQQS